MLTSSFRSCTPRCVILFDCCYSSHSSCKIVTRRMPKTTASCGGPPVPTSIEPVTTNCCLTTLQFNRRLCHRRLIDITYACRRFFASRAALLSSMPAEKEIIRAPLNRRDSISSNVIMNFSCIETANYCARLSYNAYRLSNVTIFPEILNFVDDCRRFTVFSTFYNGFRWRLIIIRRSESSIINLKGI